VYSFGSDCNPLGLNPWIGCRKLSEEAQHFQSFLIPTFACQPSRREREEEDGDEHKNSGNDGQEERQPITPIIADEPRTIRLGV
jgi:hypothetical protein